MKQNLIFIGFKADQSTLDDLAALEQAEEDQADGIALTRSRRKSAAIRRAIAQAAAHLRGNTK